jgi:hypothetical protein
MRARGWLGIALGAGIVGVTACSVGLYLWARLFFTQGGTDSDAMLAWNDRYEILDTQSRSGYRYALVRVWTTVPDLMQRVDLYCYDSARVTGEPGRADFRRSRQVLSENLDDNFHQINESGGYTARWPTRGAIDLGKKLITIEFDTGPLQLVPIPDPAVRARCRGIIGPPTAGK